MKEIMLEGTHNVRDLGGFCGVGGRYVRYHKLIRSADLASLTDQDVQCLENYGVNEVIDLRSPAEMLDSPDSVGRSIQVNNIPVFGDPNQDVAHSKMNQKQNGYASMMQGYDDLIRLPHSQQAYHEIFNHLIANSEPVNCIVYHCIGGKDRTGIVTMLILSALGVAKKDIIADYMYTNQASKYVIDQSLAQAKAKGVSDKELRDLTACLTVLPDYYEKAETVLGEFGGIRNYLTNEVGLTEAMVEQLRAIYLE